MKPVKIYLDPVTTAVPRVSSGAQHVAHKIEIMNIDNLPNVSPSCHTFYQNSSDVAHDRKYCNLKEENAHIQHMYFLYQVNFSS